MSDSFNTTEANWQGVDEVPTAGSDNLVKSGGVYEKDGKIGVRVDDVEAKTYELYGHSEEMSFVSSLILTNEHSTGYYDLKNSVPKGKTITAIKKNGQVFSGSVYIEFNDGTTDAINTASLPHSYNKQIDKIHCNTDNQHWEIFYTEPATEGMLEEKATFTTGEKVSDVGIDENLTSGSNNLAKSGTVYAEVNPIKQKQESEDERVTNSVNLAKPSVYTIQEKTYCIGSNSSYIDLNGDLQTHGGYWTGIFPARNLLKIHCKIGDNSNDDYGVAFYSSKDTIDSTTFIAEGSKRSQIGVNNNFVSEIPSNAEVVLISNRIGTLPYEEIEIALTYGNGNIKEYQHDVLTSVSSTYGIKQRLNLKVYYDITITLNNPIYWLPLYAHKGDTLCINIANDVSTIINLPNGISMPFLCPFCRIVGTSHSQRSIV
jgi:hypothetical protein